MSTEKEEVTLLESMAPSEIRELAKIVVSPQLLRLAKRLLNEKMPEHLAQDAASCTRAMSVLLICDLYEGNDESLKQGLYSIFMAGFVAGRDGWLFDDDKMDITVELAEMALEEMRKRAQSLD